MFDRLLECSRFYGNLIREQASPAKKRRRKLRQFSPEALERRELLSVTPIVPANPSDIVDASSGQAKWAYFVATNPTDSTTQVWRTDGTSQNTSIVTKLPAGSTPSDLTVAGDNVFFMVTTAGPDYQLWDATISTDKATMVKDFGNQSFGDMAGLNSDLIFLGPKGVWVSNGATASEISGTDSLTLSFFVPPVANNKAYFVADDGKGDGRQLWTTDRTSVTKVTNLNTSGLSGFDPQQLIAVGNKVFLRGDDGDGKGLQLYASDGTTTTEQTQVGTELFLGTETAVGSKLFFTVTSPTYQLWVSDGTGTGGTHMVTDFSKVGAGITPIGNNPGDTAGVGNTYYFHATDGTHGDQLWESDGVNPPVMVTNENGATGIMPTDLTAVGGTLFFVANDASSKPQLWEATGTSAQIVAVPPAAGATSPAGPANLASAAGTLLFSAKPNTVPLPATADLWESDGTAAGTVQVVAPIVTGPAVTLTPTEAVSATLTVATFSSTVTGYVATINWGDGTSSSGTLSAADSNGTITVSGTHTYTGTGAPPVNPTVVFHLPGYSDVTVTDNLTVTDAPLSGSIARINRSAFSGTVASFTDANPNGAVGDYSATIDWGDGTTSTGSIVASGKGFVVNGSHVYTTPPTKPDTVTVNDTLGSALVASTDPTRSHAAVNAALKNVVVGTFTDGDGSTPVANFTAVIDWGDGSTSTGTVTEAKGVYTISGTHTYAQEGDYTTQATVTVNTTGTRPTGSGSGGSGSTAPTAGVTTYSLTDHILIGDAHQLFVMAVYEDVLARAPDPGGLAHWTQLLDNGTPASSVAQNIGHSGEYYANFVITPAYLRLLGRAPDPLGLQGWTNAMVGGLTDQQLEAGFAASPEFYANAGGTDAGWVTAVYNLLLGRPPEPGAVPFWAGQIHAPGQSLSTVALRIATSNENNTDLINQDYFNYLGRSSDPAGLTFWLSQFAAGSSNEDVIAGFTGSPEYYNNQTS
jgi:ELWxxDGT repeat protein